MARLFKIAVDFDGTIVDHRYPEIGTEAPGAFDWLRRWNQDPRIELMLWTMRSNSKSDGNALYRAVEYCQQRDVFFAHVNHAPQDWSTSPKLYADVYIDDLAIGVPLIQLAAFKRPIVDWEQVGPMVQARFDAFVDVPASRIAIPT